MVVVFFILCSVTETPPPGAPELAAALGAAFPEYIERKLGNLGVVYDAHLSGVVQFLAAELNKSLHSLLATDPRRQPESPLEVVRSATRLITAELERIGAAHVPRDDHAMEIHPDDPYDLYPASSRDLGEEVWRLHVQWGVEKARFVAGMVPANPDAAGLGVVTVPAIALFGLAQGLRDGIRAAAENRGYRTLIWRNPAALEEGAPARPELVVVEMAHPRSHDAIRTLTGIGIRVVAVAAEVDDLLEAGIMALGAAEVVELDRIVDRLSQLLPRVV